MAKSSRKSKTECRTIDINKVRGDLGHFRRAATDTSSLKSTIADVGLLQPILVRAKGDSFIVIDGGRRLQALKDLNVPELIVGRDIIIDVDETEADFKFKQLIANVQREDLNDIELGKAFVTLKEHYSYHYNEIAEIIGKTPHYVAAKVGLAKRLTPEMQAIIVGDWQAAKCIQNTLTDEDALSPYVMNVNVIEDIARLPEDKQKDAYETIKAGEMDKAEALAYIRSIKQEAEAPKATEELAAADACARTYPGKDLDKCLKKIHRDVQKLSATLKTGDVDATQAATAIESLIEQLNMLYAEVKSERGCSKAMVSSE